MMKNFSLTQRGFRIFLLVSSVLMFVYLHHFAGVKSLWTDEVCTVSSVRDGLTFSDTVKIYASQDVQSPLFPFMFYFWYRIFPHTEQALRTLSIIFAVLACAVVGIIGRRLKGIRFGVFAFLFMAGNFTVLSNAALELRPYSLMLLVSSLNYWCYLERLNDESTTNIILYGITMGIMPYTHYVSVLFCFGMFIADCVLILRKRTGFRVIASYILGALLFLPWLIVLLRYSSHTFLSFWPEVPGIRDVMILGKWLMGVASYTDVTFLLAVLGAASIFMMREKLSDEYCFMSSGIFASVFMVILVYVYSRYINPAGSFFVERYFFPILPFAIWVVSYGADFIYVHLVMPGKKQAFALFFVIIIAAAFAKSARHKWLEQPYREAAGIIRACEAGHNDVSSAILTTDSRYMYHGLQEMYLSKSPETSLLPSYCLRPKYKDDNLNVLDSLKSKRYGRIYFCFLHTQPKEIAGMQEIMSWLQRNYDFGELDDECKMQILELRK